MTLADIKTLFDFNTWATNRVMSVVETLNEEQFVKDMGSSHGGIHGTLVHILASYEMWLSRWTGNPSNRLLSTEEVPTLTVSKKQWEQTREKLAKFLGELAEPDLAKVISYTNTKGESYSTPLGQMMQHLVNHASYHRGQITTMLRQIGVKPVNTDMIFYFRQK